MIRKMAESTIIMTRAESQAVENLSIDLFFQGLVHVCSVKMSKESNMTYVEFGNHFIYGNTIQTN